MNKTGIASLLFVLLFLLASCQSNAEKKVVESVSLPSLPSVIHLKVARVINPRFKQLEAPQVKRTLQKASEIIQQQFGVKTEFEMVETLSIESFFQLRSRQLLSERSSEILSPKKGLNAADRKRMIRSIEQSIRSMSKQVEPVYKYSRPYLKADIKQVSFESLAAALADTLLWRQKSWYQLKADDDKTILNGDGYNEWVWWDSMGYADFPYDLVLTNQLVASVEAYGMDAHSAMRGGITNGTTTYSQGGQFQTYSFVSTFAMINDYPELLELRNHDNPDQNQREDYVAALIAHEMGHLLFHYGHPYGVTECIMSPAPLLDFKSWIQGFDEKACFSGNYEAMKKGAVELSFEPHLVVRQ